MLHTKFQAPETNGSEKECFSMVQDRRRQGNF